jgi:NTE family protein
MGLAPAGLVGVSMGAIVAAAYALRPTDWYEALLAADLDGSAEAGQGLRHGRAREGGSIRRVWSYAHTTWNLITGWSAPDEFADAGRSALQTLLGSSRLEDGRIPVTVCATDLRSGIRVAFSSGPAAPAVYASSALAGVLQPMAHGDQLLADGVYSDAPTDLARRMAPVVVVVDPSQGAGAESLTNGLRVVMRAMEICHLTHAHLRIEAKAVTSRLAYSSRTSFGWCSAPPNTS